MRVDAARDALLDDARERAARRLAEAEAEAAGRIDAARRQAAATIARARERGDADGRVEAAHDEAVERSFAHMEVLAAQREAYDEFRGRARAAALSLRDDPEYPALLDRLAAAARRVLGEDAAIERDVPGAGGVRARAGTRSLDYSLVALADRCASELGPELRDLWA